MYEDLLILVSTFKGNVDYYFHLRRKGRSVKNELHCLVLQHIYSVLVQPQPDYLTRGNDCIG